MTKRKEVLRVLKPLGDRVVVKVDDSPELSPGGIVLPDAAQEKPQRGVVVSVGEGKRLDDGKIVALDVKVGDRVIFSKYGGVEVRDGNEEFVILRQDDIYAVDTSAPKPVSAAAAPKPAAQKAGAKKAPVKKTPGKKPASRK